MKAIIVLAVLFVALSAQAVTIVPNSTRMNDDDVTVFFTLTDGGISYEWHGDFAKGLNINDQLEAQKDKIHLLILKRQYRGAEPVNAEGETDLESMKRWVTDGAENVKIHRLDGEDVEVTESISKAEWKSTHPGLSVEDRLTALESK